jgi:hypothetical protein
VCSKIRRIDLSGSPLGNFVPTCSFM